MENQADLAPAEEIALARAAANQALNPVISGDSFVGLTVAAPSALTAPSSVVLAGVIYTAPGAQTDTQLIKTEFSLGYHTSGAGDLTVVFRLIGNATAIAGGSVAQDPWHFENGGVAVSITGDAPVVLATLVQTNAGVGSNVLTWSAPGIIGGGEPVGFEILVSCGQNLSVMTLSALIAIVGQ